MFINAWRRFPGGLKNRITARAARDGSRRRCPQLFLEPLEPRIVLSTNTWLNSLGGSWNDPSNWNTGAVPTTADNVVINLSPAATIRISGGTASVNSLQVNNSLVLDGAALTVAGDVTNAGEIDLTSTAGSADASLTVDGLLTNSPTGLLLAEQGAGGNRYIIGDWINQGTVDAQSNLVLSGSNGSGPDFTQAGGDITTEGAGISVVQGGGVFHYTGGAISGDFIVVGTELDVQSTVTATALIEVRGQDNILDENAAPNVTLEVEGSDNNGDGVLTAADGAVNDGVISLDTVGWYWWLNSSLDVASGGTFTNAAGGAIVVNTDSGGGRYLNGNIVNQGEITANSNEQWSGNLTNAGTIDIVAGVEVDVNGATSTLSQTGGELDVEGTLSVNGAALDITGGALNGGGTLLVQNSQLSFGGDAAGPLVVQAVGQGNVLLNNLAPGVTIWVRGDDRFNDGVLTVAPDAVNAGTILLESASSWWWSILSIQDTLDNTSTGVIQVSLGAGGGRSIQGNLSNEGTIAIDADASVTINGNGDDGPTLTQNDGVIQANGQLLLNGGMLDFEGGAITGNFYAENAQLYVSPDVADPSVVYAVGGGDVLLDNASESTTIIVQGDDRYNAAVLTVAADATNAGVIQLTSTSTYWGSVLATPDMLDNTPTGQILVTAGAGGERWLNGDLDNEGLVSVNAGVELQENGATSAGPTFIQDGGSIQATGQFVVNGGLFDFESGDVSGLFYVNSAQIYVSPDAVDPATIYVVGSGNTLLGNEGPQVTLRVEGDDAFNAGVLTAAAGAVNAGSIVLASTSDYWGSILDAPNTLLNAQGGLIAVADDDSGEGVRWLQGDFINAGTIFTPTDRQLTLQGDASDAAPTLIQDGGLIAADGSFVQDGGLFDFESGGVVGSFLVNGASIYVGPEVVDPSTIEIVGPNNTLLENASAATTLWVQGNDGYNAGVLTAAPGAFNAGTIALASVSDYWGETLAAPDGLDNLVGGHIAVFGGGGPAVLSGDLTNDGYLSLSGVSNLYIDTLVNNGTVGVDATAQSLAPGLTALGDASASLEAITGESTSASQEPSGADGGSFDVTQVTVGAWTNNGTVAVDPGTQLEIAPDDSGRATFTQAGGLVAADGNLIVDGGLFHYTGGAIWGAFTVRNGQIQVDASVTQPAVIDVVGQGNTLLDNAGDATLVVQGGSPLGDGDAVLTAADASTNAGTIILESLDGVHHGYFRVPAGTFTNEPGGLIQVNLPPGDAGQGVVTAGWLEGADASGDAAGAVSDTTSQQVLEPVP